MEEVIYIVSTKEKALQNMYKPGRHTGSLGELISRYTTAIINPIVYFFHSVKNACAIETELKQQLYEHRIVNDNNSKLEWVRMDLNILITTIYDIEHVINTGKSKNKSNNKLSSGTKMDLCEKIDMDVLQKIISVPEIESIDRKKLLLYYNKINDDKCVPVEYFVSTKLQKIDSPHIHTSLSLQDFNQEIQHALIKNNYYDIHIENSHVDLLYQYCVKNEIDCTKLSTYINDSDTILENIMEFHDIEEDDATKLILKLCHIDDYVIETDESESAYEPKKKFKFLLNFQNEVKEIAKTVRKIEKDTYGSNNPDLNKKTIICTLINFLENTCIMTMYDYFKDNDISVGVLYSNSIMIDKCTVQKNMLRQMLDDCEKYIKKKTTYEIKLKRKQMTSELPYNLPQFSKYVNSDMECVEKLFDIEGKDKFKYCKNVLYVFNEKTGIFDTGNETLFSYLIKNKKYFNSITRINTAGNAKTKNYGDSSTLQHKIVQFVKTMAKDDEWLEKTQNTSLGYLLFQDGIYNMRDGTFVRDFNPKIVFHARVPWKFPPRDKTEMKKAREISFDRIFENPEPMITALAVALAGDFRIKKFYFCPGRSNAGKSKLVKMLNLAFGDYIGHFNAESLAYASDHDSKDEAAKIRWALLLRFSRILLSNEINMKKNLDANAIKKHSSGGDKITGRTHHGEEVSFVPHYTIFCMLNDIPKIEPMDQGVVNRLEYIEFPYVFVDEKDLRIRPYNRQRDINFDDKIEDKSFIYGFIHIILDAYKRYIRKGMPDFDSEVKNKWTAENKHNVEIIELMRDNFEITNDLEDMITVKELNDFKNRHKKVFSTISVHRFHEILKEELLLEEYRDANARYWRGIKNN